MLLTQASYRQLQEDTVDKIEEPHIREYLAELAVQARKHEEKFAVLFGEPSDVRTLLGQVMGTARQAPGDFIAVAGGATGPWQDLHQLYLSNYNSMGAIAVAEQLGLALGIPRIAEIAFGMVAEQSTGQLLLQECILEMSSMAILY